MLFLKFSYIFCKEEECLRTLPYQLPPFRLFALEILWHSYERLARWKRRKDYYNKMDNDIPENQQDREIAVSAIKHLDQSKKRKLL